MKSARDRSDAAVRDANAFRQQERMAAVQVTGLRHDELALALAYEVEPFSGIPASEADVSFTPVADPDSSVRVYDVSVRRRAAATGGERCLKPLILLGALALALAAGDFLFTSVKLRERERTVARRTELQRQLDAIRRPTATLRSDARARRESREAAARAQKNAALARGAYAKLLSAVAEACGDRAVLTELKGGDSSLHVRGVAVSATAAAEVLVALTASASTLEWRLAPGRISVRDPGLTADFECELTHD